jgi:hypothetical protein
LVLRALSSDENLVFSGVREQIVHVHRSRGDDYTFEAATRFDKLFTGIVVQRPACLTRGNRGAEHIGPEDTFDGDDGRLLERIAMPRFDGTAVVRLAGLEPATSWFVARRSIQLS